MEKTPFCSRIAHCKLPFVMAMLVYRRVILPPDFLKTDPNNSRYPSPCDHGTTACLGIARCHSAVTCSVQCAKWPALLRGDFMDFYGTKQVGSVWVFLPWKSGFSLCLPIPDAACCWNIYLYLGHYWVKCRDTYSSSMEHLDISIYLGPLVR